MLPNCSTPHREHHPLKEGLRQLVPRLVEEYLSHREHHPLKEGLRLELFILSHPIYENIESIIH